MWSQTNIFSVLLSLQRTPRTMTYLDSSVCPFYRQKLCQTDECIMSFNASKVPARSDLQSISAADLVFFFLF